MGQDITANKSGYVTLYGADRSHVEYLEKLGYEVRGDIESPNCAVIAEGWQRPVRLKSLGAKYTPDAIYDQLMRNQRKPELFWIEMPERSRAPLLIIEYHLRQAGKMDGLQLTFAIFTELLKYNYPPAFTNIGIIFMNGTGYEKSLRRASQYFMVAAKMNEPTAQMHLGSMYAKGIYLSQSDSLALYWYMKSAKQGLAESQVATGRILMYSDHFKKDADAAAYWFREAAIKDHPDGLFMYGLYLNKYKYHFEDRELGNFYNCIQHAARLGHEDAQIELMMSSRQQRNYKVTLKWARALHERGNNEGTRILAECYMLGRGVNKDYDRAKELYGEAAAKGDKEAKNILEDW